MQSDYTFRSNLTNRTHSKYIYASCTKCKRSIQRTDHQSLFTWSHCNHPYCSPCASNLVTECLSLFNTIPKCCSPKCNAILNKSDAKPLQSFIPKEWIYNKCNISVKWTINTKSNYQHFRLLQLCLFGYIRQNTSQYVTMDITNIIFDYFHLIQHSKIICSHCSAVGYFKINCTYCNRRGYTKKCKTCHNSGIFKYTKDCRNCNGSTNIYKTCNKCGGDGDYIRDRCNRCQGSGRYTKSFECRKCKGSGEYHGKYGDLMAQCHPCNGTGRKHINKQCNGCNGTGIFQRDCNRCDGKGRTVHSCKTCRGKGKFHLQRTCPTCNGTGFHKEKCYDCVGNGYTKRMCLECNGDRFVMALDFIKVCNKQSLCHKCNQYYPNQYMEFWRKCQHSFCRNCILTHIHNEFTKNERMPLCAVQQCYTEMSADKLNGICNYFKDKTVERDFEQLMWKQNHFVCSFCRKHHDKMNIFYWSECNHRYGRHCARSFVGQILQQKGSILDVSSWQSLIPVCHCSGCNEMMSLEDADNVDVSIEELAAFQHRLEQIEFAKSHFKCSFCSKWHCNNDCLSWSKCGHKYSKECMIIWLNKCIQQKESLFDGWTNALPVCKVTHCEEVLSICDAGKIGANNYQIRKLWKMQKRNNTTNCIVM